MVIKDKNKVAVLGSSVNNKHDEEEDDFENDPWNMDTFKKAKPVAAKEAVKANPFDQKIKPAFDDLEDIDLGIVDPKKKPTALPEKKVA